MRIFIEDTSQNNLKTHSSKGNPSKDKVFVDHGCKKCGQAYAAIKCFKKMKDIGISPDVVTFTCILKACGSVGSLSCGKHIHDEIMNEGYWGKVVILGNALIDMYVKCDNHFESKRST